MPVTVLSGKPSSDCQGRANHAEDVFSAAMDAPAKFRNKTAQSKSGRTLRGNMDATPYTDQWPDNQCRGRLTDGTEEWGHRGVAGLGGGKDTGSAEGKGLAEGFARRVYVADRVRGFAGAESSVDRVAWSGPLY